MTNGLTTFRVFLAFLKLGLKYCAIIFFVDKHYVCKVVKSERELAQSLKRFQLTRPFPPTPSHDHFGCSAREPIMPTSYSRFFVIIHHYHDHHHHPHSHQQHFSAKAIVSASDFLFLIFFFFLS